ncbi:MAG: DUF47 domain-containing protein [Verrucomicrobia bacterium]|jgi:predicted phosphate transport protein (TIGR00153 family)|nr:DUF47 domain-containing protein [Verrucomicrobiota bacterium]
MYYLSKLFAKAPFDLLQLHMEKVIACLSKLDDVLRLWGETSQEELEELSKKVSELEYDADLIKNEIRTLLPRRFLFSVDRHNFLEILALQDKLSDIAEDIAGLLSLKLLEIPPSLKEPLRQYQNKTMETVWEVKEIVFSFDQLLEVSFGGPVAEKIRTQIEKTAHKEHEAEVLGKILTKALFQIGDDLKTADFYLWIRLIEDMGRMAHLAEKIALRIGMLLDIR